MTSAARHAAGWCTGMGIALLGASAMPSTAAPGDVIAARSVLVATESIVPQTGSRSAVVFNDATPPNTTHRGVLVYNDQAAGVAHRSVLVSNDTPAPSAGRSVLVFNENIPMNAEARRTSMFNQSCTKACSGGVCTACLVVSSNDAAYALPVTGSLPAQLATLNAGPPVFNSNTWAPVHLRNDNSSTAAFRCESVPDPLALPYVNALVHPDTAWVQPGLHPRNRNEATYDNCSSAFYRYTFQLPNQFASPVLVGACNLDDQGVVFLNGHRASGAMTNPGCSPASGAGDPCYLAQDTGRDRYDVAGRQIMTRPGLDTFAADSVSWFRAGLNEIVFAVAGDAEYTKPTGLEFVAFVSETAAPTDAGPDSTTAVPAEVSLHVRHLLGPTTATFASVGLPQGGVVTLRLYDVAGRRVREVFNGSLPSGVHKIPMPLGTAGSARLASGIYFAKLTTNGIERTARVVVAR